MRLPAPSTNENPTSAPDATMLFVCETPPFGIVPRSACWMSSASVSVNSPRGSQTSAFSMPCAVMWLGCEPLRPYWFGFDLACRTRTISAMSVWPSQFASPQSVMSARSGKIALAAVTAASRIRFVIRFMLMFLHPPSGQRHKFTTNPRMAQWRPARRGPYQIANLHEDNFDCFRCWEIGSLGVKEVIINLNTSFRYNTPCYTSRRGAERQSSQRLSHCLSMYLFSPIG